MYVLDSDILSLIQAGHPRSASVVDGSIPRTSRKIGRAELLIASIALFRHATLVTRNLQHFQLIPGLRVENWAN